MEVKNKRDFSSKIKDELPGVTILQGDTQSMIRFAYEDEAKVMAKFEQMKGEDKQKKEKTNKMKIDDMSFHWVKWPDTPREYFLLANTPLRQY